MKYSKKELTLEHVKESLSMHVLIGSDNARNGARKTFSYNPWANEYRIECNHQFVAGGQAVEELLDEYNSL
jgi:hypothetical protein